MENRRTRMSKRLMKTALVALMNEKPLEKITIKELCARAEVNPSTFYANYSTKNEVFSDVLQDLSDAIAAAFTGPALPATAPESLKEQFVAMFKATDRMREEYIIAYEHGASELTNVLFDTFRDLVKQNWNLAGKIPSEWETYLFRYALSGGITLAYHWVKEEKREPVREMAELMAEMTYGVFSSVFIQEK